MPPFNPNVPSTNDPNYLGYSRPNSSDLYTGNKTFGAALEGLGNVFKSAVEGADTIVKDTIDKALYARVDEQREGFTGALEEIAGVPPEQRVADYRVTNPDSSVQGSPLNILTPDSTPPTGVDAQLTGVNSAVSGLNAGRASPLHYIAALDTIAKSLRADFPGYRDYIDTKIASITGGNPANEYYKLLISGINSNRESSKSDLDKARTYVMNHPEYDDASTVSAILATGKVKDPINFVTQWATKATAADADLKRRAAQRNDFKGSREELTIRARDDLSKLAGDEVTKGYNVFDKSVKLTLGNETIEGASLEDLGQYVDLVQKGAIKPNDEQIKALGAAYKAMVNNLRNRIIAKAERLGGKNGTLIDILGSDAEGVINGRLSALNNIAKNIEDKDFGAAYRNHNAFVAITDDTGVDYLNAEDPDLKLFNRYGAVIGKISPNAAADFLRSNVIKGISGKTDTYFKRKKMEILAQPDPSKPTTLKAIIQDMKNKGVGTVPPNVPNDPGNPAANPNSEQKKSERKLIEDLTEVPSKLVNKEYPDTFKLNIIKAAFSPENWGMIAEFADDKVVADPNTRQFVQGYGWTMGTKVIPGSHMTFAKMTTSDIAKEVYRLSNKYDHTIWDNYKNWVAGEHRALFQKDLLDLNVIASDPNIKVEYRDDPNNPGWTAVYEGPITRGTSFDIVAVNRKLGFVNSSLKTLGSIGKLEGSDPNAYILKTMLGEGVNPQGTDMSAKMIQALRNIKAPVANGTEPENLNKLPKQGSVSLKNEPTKEPETISIDVKDIPKGMTPQQFIDSLKANKG